MVNDIKIEMKHYDGTADGKQIFRMMFNTSFIHSQFNFIEAGKMELSPENIRKDKGKVLDSNFAVYFWFEDYCAECAKI